MMALSFLGTGLMKIVNIFLILVITGGLIYAAWSAFTEGYREEGRKEVTTEVEEHNRKLDRVITEVNEKITRRVINTDETIDRRSDEIEDKIDAQPSEPITNVTRTRIDGVREQQRDIREAS